MLCLHPNVRGSIFTYFNHVLGPTYFEYLKTVNGNMYTTFNEAAEMRELLQHDDYVHQCLCEACFVKMPSSIRRLFVSILVFCQPTKVWELWDELHPYMSEDYGRSISTNCSFITNKLIIEIRRLLHQYKKKIDDFDLSSINVEFLSDLPLPRIIEDDLSIEIPDEYLRSIEDLNTQQKMAFDAIMESVVCNQPKLWFIDGPGGSEKTFVYRVLLAHLIKSGKIVIYVATFEIAATLFPGEGQCIHAFHFDQQHQRFVQ